MNKAIGLAAAAALMVSGGFAQASDIYGNSTKDGGGAFASTGVVNWTGVYISGGIGYGNANHNLGISAFEKDTCHKQAVHDSGGAIDPEGPARYIFDSADCTYNSGTQTDPVISQGVMKGANSHGVVGDIRAGFDFARGRFLFGVFGEYGLSAMETSASLNLGGPVSINVGLEKEDEWSVGGRLGYLVAPRTLVYALAAYTQTEYNVTGNAKTILRDNFDVKQGATFSGISVGGGIEFALTGNVFLGMEYKHTFYGKEDIFTAFDAECNKGYRITDDLDEDKIMARLTIKLNSGIPGISD